MSASNRLIVSILAVAALAIAFWMLVLGPKREEASELSGQVGQLQASLAEAQAKATEAAAARDAFPADYRELVVLGQAVPEGDETSSLLVELDHVANTSRVKFASLQLNGSGEESTPAATTPPTTPETPSTRSSSAVPASATIPPTEAAASVLPLGASVGAAGLGVMPYNLSFNGDFFHVADFIKGIDGLVHTGGEQVSVDGRLMTLDGFALNSDPTLGFPHLNATFAVTTYVTPPEHGVVAGATSAAPAPAVTTPAGAGEAATEAASTEAAPAESTQVASR